MILQELPIRSGLEQYEKQAKKLISVYKSRDMETMYLIGRFHPRLPGRANTNDRNKVTEADIQRAGFTVSDAQAVVAGWHGFESWSKLATHVAALARKNSRVLQFESAVEAIITGDAVTLKTLLRQNPALIRARSTREHHATLLHYVSANGVEGYRQKTPKNAVKIARILLDAGAEVDADFEYRAPKGRRYPERRGSTTLGLVATSVHPLVAGVQIPLLKALLDYGAAVNSPWGGTAVNACLANGRGEAAAFLARRGGRVDLEGAAGVGRLDLVNRFFKKGGTLKANATKDQLMSGFAWACEYGRTSVVDFLLKRGVEIDAPLRHHGQTGLHWAAFGGHAGTVKLLLKRGAPVDAKDQSFGGTPLGWALYGWCEPAAGSNRTGFYEVVVRLVAA